MCRALSCAGRPVMNMRAEKTRKERARISPAQGPQRPTTAPAAAGDSRCPTMDETWSPSNQVLLRPERGMGLAAGETK